MSSNRPSSVSQAQVNDAVWNACDTFRGVVDPSQYKDYILVVLFWKYASDLWSDHYEDYRKRYGDDEERIRRRLANERFVLPEGTSFSDLHAKRNADNLGELINVSLETIEEENKSKLKGVLTNIDFNSTNNLGETKERNRRLKKLLEDFAKPELDFRPSRFGGERGAAEDVIGEAYISTIENFAADAGKKAGEFFTPAKVSELLVKLAGPKPGDRICDPTCGSGTLLIRAAEAIGDYVEREELDEKEARNYALFGQEVNRSTAGLARMNMFLHHQDGARIEIGNTITAPALIENDRLIRFDIVVANPPFSLKAWGDEEATNDAYNRFHRGVPPKSKGDYAFISHMIETAKPGKGRVAVIAPHGILFRGGKEGVIRKQLVDENLLDAVIGLPAQLFPTTGIPVCMAIFDRAREKGGKRADKETVVFIDASRDFVPGRKQNQVGDNQIARIVETYHADEPEERYSAFVTREQIKANDYNLNIPRYVDTFEAEEEIDLAAVQKEIVELEDKLAETRKRMDDYLKELGFGA